MTTPAGYYDSSGQFIPGSFAQVLDLPGPQAGSAVATAAEKAYRSAQQASNTALQGLTTAKANIKRLNTLVGNKRATPAQRAAYGKQLAAAKAELSRFQNTYTSVQKQIPTLQTKYYEASGQYDKLLTGQNRDAYAALTSLFNQFGLGSLAGKIYDYVKQGYGADTITLLLQDTKEYKTRFAANETRAKAGLPVLSPAEYLETESAYRQILNSAGLPKGFYDNPADFNAWIAGDVSPTELKSRVDIAVANTLQGNPYTQQALAKLYGVDQSYITAWALDQKRALPLIQKQAQAAQFGAEAIKRGLTLNTRDLEEYVTAGLSLNQVSEGFQAVAEALPNIQAIAARYGESFTQHELERDLIAGDTSAGLNEAPTLKRKRLASQERALFSGFGGATPGGLSAGSQQT